MSWGSWNKTFRTGGVERGPGGRVFDDGSGKGLRVLVAGGISTDRKGTWIVYWQRDGEGPRRYTLLDTFKRKVASGEWVAVD